MNYINMDTMSVIKDFVGDEEYLTIAPLSKNWGIIWGISPRTTRAITKHTTIDKLILYMKTRDLSVAETLGRYESQRNIMERIASVGSINLLEFLKNYNFVWDEQRILQAAAMCGQLHTLKWLQKHHCLFGHNRERGTLEHLRANNLEESIAIGASMGGHVDILEWGSSDDHLPKILSCAAYAGHIHVLEWVFEKKKHYRFMNDRSTCSSAASGGHLNILKWARMKGFDWDFRTIDNARWFGHDDIMEWALDNGCPQFFGDHMDLDV